MSAMLGASESEHTSTAGAAAATRGGAISKAFYIRNNIGQWNAEKTQLMQDFTRLQELVGLLQVHELGIQVYEYILQSSSSFVLG